MVNGCQSLTITNPLVMHIHTAACHEVLLLVDGGDENDMHSWEFLTHYLQLAWRNLAKS